MASDDDPLQFFTADGPPPACIGEWKNDRLHVKIFDRDGKLVLEAGRKELVLTEVGDNVWSVCDEIAPDVEIYVAEVSGYGEDTQLLMKPARKKEGGKAATLWRVEHLGGKKGRDGKDGDGREDRRRRSSASPRRRSPRRRRSPVRSRSRSDNRSPYRGKGGSKGEEVTTIFVTGLPDDAREDEVREDCEAIGRVSRVVMMRRGGETNSFVRFEMRSDARRAMEDILDGRLEVCQAKVKAEMARRNTN
mmetsp:Transcript_55852/g.130710  ORF Transcript_55852/g.130710 Transcript_55852/m.130710 type:complete len:248 (+) Transcript_55852:16-759(+)